MPGGIVAVAVEAVGGGDQLFRLQAGGQQFFYEFHGRFYNTGRKKKKPFAAGKCEGKKVFKLCNFLPIFRFFGGKRRKNICF